MRVLCALLLGLFLSLSVQAESDSPKAQVAAWSSVEAIFAEHCTMCHGPQGAPHGLRLDSYANALAGSDNGPILVSGDAEASELIRRLRGISTPRMPFLGYPLPDEEIDLIARWIDAGAPDEN